MNKVAWSTIEVWGQATLNKITSLVGKPVRINRATTKKDIIEYAQILVEMHMYGSDHVSR